MEYVIGPDLMCEERFLVAALLGMTWEKCVILNVVKDLID